MPLPVDSNVKGFNWLGEIYFILFDSGNQREPFDFPPEASYAQIIVVCF